MATQKLNLTRDQLATFLKTHEQVKQFESLFQIVDSIAPDVVQGLAIEVGNASALAGEALSITLQLGQDLSIEVGNANQKAVQALDALERIASAIEFMAMAPRAELGTMSSQNADNVSITGGKISGLDVPLPVASGGTGQSTFTDGQLLIGNGTGNTLAKALLTQGTNITITNGPGSITIAVSGLGTMALENIGASGSFTAQSGEVITVANGVITSIV